MWEKTYLRLMEEYCFVFVFSPFYIRMMPITTNVVSSNPAHGEVYSIQHYVIKIISDLRQLRGFLWILRFPPPIKLTARI
jgi:hypothetical protein